MYTDGVTWLPPALSSSCVTDGNGKNAGRAANDLHSVHTV